MEGGKSLGKETGEREISRKKPALRNELAEPCQHTFLGAALSNIPQSMVGLTGERKLKKKEVFKQNLKTAIGDISYRAIWGHVCV